MRDKMNFKVEHSNEEVWWNFFLFIERIGVTLTDKIIQVSGAQFHTTSSVHCTVCSPPKPSLLPSLSSYTPPPPLRPAVTTLVSRP